uniref:NaTx n=1 Tax=Centruroides hentzi TaxID=88313 RepID=A0A2I9LPC5_9SCOR
MFKILILAVILLTLVKIEVYAAVNGFLVSKNGCLYPCYYEENSKKKCNNRCYTLGGSRGYCKVYTCYCEDLPVDVNTVKSITNSPCTTNGN